MHAARFLGLSPEEKAERKKQAQEVRVQQEYRKRLLEEVWKRVPGELSRHELDLIAQSYFHVLGHDSQPAPPLQIPGVGSAEGQRLVRRLHGLSEARERQARKHDHGRYRQIPHGV